VTEVQELVARLRLDDKMTGPLRKVRAGISGVSDALNHPRMQRGISQIGTGLRNAAAIAAVGIGALVTQVAAGLGQLVQLEDLAAATGAAIKSTGGIAGVTAQDVRRMSEEFENLNAVIDDKVIQSGANLLLTFTNVREEVFEEGLEAALNLSTAMGQDLNSSILQIGKALQDPIRGMTALRRAGVQFTKDQEAQIKALVETGDLLGAQKIILQELGTEFGGRFAAQGKTAKGTIAGIGDAVEDLQKGLATALFPAIQKVLPRIRELLTSPAFTKGAEDLGRSIAGLFSDQNIAAGMDIIKSGIATAREAAPIIRDAAKATFAIVQSAVSVFRSLPPEVQKLAIGAFAINKLTGGLVTNIAGGLISSVLKQLVSGVVNVQGGVVNVVGAGGVPGVGPAAGGKGGLGSKVGTALNVILPLAAATVIGDAIIEATGGTTGGKGRVVGEGPGGIQVVIGRSMAANGAAVVGELKKQGRFQGGKLDTIANRLNPDRTKDDRFNPQASREGSHASTRLTSAELKAFRDVNVTNADLKILPQLLSFYKTSVHPSEKSIANDMKVLRSMEAQFLATGDTKNAAIVQGAIKTLQQVLASQEAREATKTRAANQQAAFQIRDKVQTTGARTKTAIDNAKTNISNAARNAGAVSAAAIRNKKLTANVRVVANSYITVKGLASSVSFSNKFGAVAS
jgi:hypothetical protein